MRERKSPRLDDDRQPSIGDPRAVEGTASPAAAPARPEALAEKDVRSVPKIGVWSWSFVGVVAATVIVVIALGAVSEIMLPLLFAAVLAVIFRPLVGKLERRTLDIHPLLVLVVTALGGFLVGIVGLILAVPITVIAGKALGRLRSRGFLTLVADRAEPTIQKMLN